MELCSSQTFLVTGQGSNVHKGSLNGINLQDNYITSGLANIQARAELK